VDVGPGRISTVRGLMLVGHDAGAAWAMSADRASGDIDLTTLGDRRFVGRNIVASGVRFAVDREQGTGEPGKKGPWEIDVEALMDADQITLDGLDFTGDLHVAGHLLLADAIVADLEARLTGGQVSWGDTVAATAVSGPVSVRLDALPRKGAIGRSAWSHVSGGADLHADIEGFSFLDPYLDKVPWLEVFGTGSVDARVQIEAGRFLPGSVVDAATQDLHVQFLDYDIAGDGHVHLAVDGGASPADPSAAPVDPAAVVAGAEPVSHLDVTFGAFQVTGSPVEGQPADAPLVTGSGFTLKGTTTTVSLAEPVDAIDLVLDLPQSEAPNLAVYNAWVPTDIGFALTGGRGGVRGELRASTRDGLAVGKVILTGDEVSARFDDLSMNFDFTLLAMLREGNLAEKTYDFSGTTLTVRQFGMREREPDPAVAAAEGEGPEWSEARDWWVTVSVPSGRAMVGRQEYLDAQITFEAADSAPFVRLVSQRKEFPGWLQKALAIPDVLGTGHLRLGLDSMRLGPLHLNVGDLYEVGMRWHRGKVTNKGALYAAYGNLSVGFHLDGDTRELVPFGARKWFASLEQDMAAGEAAADAETSKRPVIRWMRKDKPEDGEAEAPSEGEPASVVDTGGKSDKKRKKKDREDAPAPD
jgi:translocation and assembly module TamB